MHSPLLIALVAVVSPRFLAGRESGPVKVEGRVSRGFGPSPQGVLHLNGRELLFGEATISRRNYPTFRLPRGEEKGRSQALSICMNLHMG